MMQLGRFRLLGELGRGGHGIVFLAYDPALRRQVALNVPRPEVPLTPELRQRFLREAHTAAGLDHPGLVPIYEAGEDGSVCYIASAYCPGRSLAAWLQEQAGSMEPRAAARLVATAAEAVHYMHSRGVLHRDLKPANILLQTDSLVQEAERTAPYPESASAIPEPRLSPAQPSPGTPKITDFGLAKQMDAADPKQTQTGAVLGTPAYMAPEQAAGRTRDISTATDIYALGAILYECLTGRPPFGGASDQPLLERVLAEEPTPPRRLRPSLPRDLETVCLKCLHKDSRRRYSSALALAEDLENWLEHRPIAARPASARERLVKWSRRRPAAAAALACVSAAMVLVVLAGSLWHSQVLSRALDDLGHALDESNHLRREGLAREARLGDLLYVADRRLAKEAWDNGDLIQLAELLDRHRPEDGQRRPLFPRLGFALGRAPNDLQGRRVRPPLPGVLTGRQYPGSRHRRLPDYPVGSVHGLAKARAAGPRGRHLCSRVRPRRPHSCRRQFRRRHPALGRPLRRSARDLHGTPGGDRPPGLHPGRADAGHARGGQHRETLAPADRPGTVHAVHPPEMGERPRVLGRRPDSPGGGLAAG
ncbi:MAG TPA: serine/threonine-protein kinase [Gemmataceae bacterium]